MRAAIRAIRLRLWRIKVRVLPWTRPPQPPKLAAKPWTASMRLPAPIEAARELTWSELLDHYLPPLDGLTLLDLGCRRGELLGFFAETTRAAALIGVDDEPNWTDGDGAPTSTRESERVRLIAGELPVLGVAERSVDVIVCGDYLEHRSPESVRETLSACFDLLRPGGSLIVRTQLWTAAAPTPVCERFATPYAHMLIGERDLARLLRARFDERLPYINWLTATTYVTLFHQAGFEVLDMRRTTNDVRLDEQLARRLEQTIPAASADELARRLDAHLVRPFRLEDLARSGQSEDTRPRSILDRTTGR